MTGGNSALRPEVLTGAYLFSDFGGEVLRGTDINSLLNRACNEVADILDVKYTKVLEYLPSEKKLLVRAGRGWNKNVVGRSKLGADLASPAGYALQTGQPTIANDLESEQRFRIPDLLRRHKVVSAVNVIIRSDDFVFGILEADSRLPRAFDARDVQFLQGYANMLALAITQQRLSAEHAALLHRTAILLEELRHRTKNNNQLLLSLIRLKTESQQHLESRQALADISRNIEMLNELDYLISSADESGKIDLGKYLLSVTNKLLPRNDSNSATLRMQVEISEIEVNSNRAQSLAMIVNEFITNSMKHGIGETVELSLVLRRDKERALLELKDSGPGLPQNVVQGLGMQIIAAMCSSIDANCSWPPGSGTCLRVEFPIDG